MNDARLRVFCTLALSLAAFTSVAGAALVCLWWVIFSRRRESLPAPKTIALVVVPLVVAAVATEIASGGGPSYLFRLSAVFLVAFWAYGERCRASCSAQGRPLPATASGSISVLPARWAWRPSPRSKRISPGYAWPSSSKVKNGVRA